LGYTPRFVSEIKDEKRSAKDGAPEAQMRDNPEENKLDPAVNDCRRCKKNSPSVLFCINKRTKKDTA